MIKTVHENSITCYHETEIEREKRHKLIMSIYEREPNECFTDRQVALRLGFNDLNQVRPRISEAIDDYKLAECGKVRCQITGKLVRLVKLYVKHE